jgi:uncharacterized ferredoxin-like protein
MTTTATGINMSMSEFLLRNISSKAGLTRKARADVIAPTTSMQNIARMNFDACGFASCKRRLKIFTVNKIPISGI